MDSFLSSLRKNNLSLWLGLLLGGSLFLGLLVHWWLSSNVNPPLWSLKDAVQRAIFPAEMLLTTSGPFFEHHCVQARARSYTSRRLNIEKLWLVLF